MNFSMTVKIYNFNERFAPYKTNYYASQNGTQTEIRHSLNEKTFEFWLRIMLLTLTMRRIECV